MLMFGRGFSAMLGVSLETFEASGDKAGLIRARLADLDTEIRRLRSSEVTITPHGAWVGPGLSARETTRRLKRLARVRNVLESRLRALARAKSAAGKGPP